MDSRIETAVRLFAAGCSCAQAVFVAYAPRFGIEQTTALKIATGFGGGMGRLQEVCGAVTGAFMVLGACCGMETYPDKQAKERTYGLVQELGRRFASLHGSFLCRTLLGCDLNTAEGRARFEAQKLAEKKCSGYVRDACLLLEHITQEAHGSR